MAIAIANKVYGQNNFLRKERLLFKLYKIWDIIMLEKYQKT